MGKVYYDQDGHIEAIQDKVIAIIGYGNQGRSQALNMRDSGAKHIIVGKMNPGTPPTPTASPLIPSLRLPRRLTSCSFCCRTKWLPRSTSAISLPTCIPAQH